MTNDNYLNDSCHWSLSFIRRKIVNLKGKLYLCGIKIRMNGKSKII